jgi:hypothetical protein
MKERFCVAVLTGFALVALAPAQSSGPQSAPAGQTVVATEAAIPVDQQASKEQLRKLFEVTRMRQQFDEMMKMLPNMGVQQQKRVQMHQLTAKLPGARQLTPEQQKAMGKLMNRYMEKARSLYPADEVIEEAIAVCQRHITREDADVYIAFFSSPPGQRFLDAQPAIMKE